MTTNNTFAPNTTEEVLPAAEMTVEQVLSASLPTHVPVIKVNLNEYGIEQSMHHKGNPNALYNTLLEIRSGHIIDENSDEVQQEKHRKELDEKIAVLEKEIVTLNTDGQHLSDVSIPSLERSIDELEEEIHEWRLERHQSKKPTARNQFTLWRAAIFSGIGFVYLVAFYVSAVYMGMTRDISVTLQEIQQKGEGLGGVFNAIFSKDAFTTFNFHWFAPIPLLMFAMVLEKLYTEYQGKKRWLFVGIAGISTLVLDVIIAYKIEATNQKLQFMIGQEGEVSAWYTSPDFWAVLMMGFVSTIVWGIVVATLLEELSKTNYDQVVNLEIEKRKEKITGIREKIDGLKKEFGLMMSKVNQLKIDIDRLSERKQNMKVSLSELDNYASRFYDGWIKLVGTLPNKQDLLGLCEERYQDFRSRYLSE
ncbi:hypothetical protein ACWA1C_22500 [Flectobacillus roseus]